MIVKCKKIISPATGKDLGDSSPWIKKNKSYTVLAIRWAIKNIEILLESEHYQEPVFFEFNFELFELVSNKISSYWVLGKDEDDFICFMPSHWFKNGFGEAMDNGDEGAMMIYRKDRDLMFNEDPIKNDN